MKEYKYPIGLTQQFRFCGNPFRLDFIRSCDFGCIYCYVNIRKVVCAVADVDKVLNLIRNCHKYKSVTAQCLQRKIPLHLGGMSDPFQKLEFEMKLAYRYFMLKYPTMISTKTAWLPDEYFDVLDPKYHVFQISLIGLSEGFIRVFERRTYSPDKRLRFIELLKKKGFKVTLRLQPLIYIDEALSLIKRINDLVDFVTIEHIKIPSTRVDIRDYLFSVVPYNKEDFVKTRIHFELKTDIKLRNVEKIRKVIKVPLGVGDNDLHGLSDTLNCCGVDLFFDNWLKYNRLYLQKTGDYSVWYPKGSVSSSFNSATRIKGFSYKEYVDDFIKKNPLTIFK